MDSPFNNDWIGNLKYEASSTSKTKGNVARSWQWRERGMNPSGAADNKRVLEEIAEDHLVNKKQLDERCCNLPGVPRSTFLMVFSPDGTKVASTHGNHNIYVSELASGDHVRTLRGHPRTPWCIAFHPSHAQIVGSGCLGGQVRVWDLSGGSEVWTVGSETVIASIAFHPREQLLVVATYNELYFWDWSQPQPFTRIQTSSIKEKIRFVSFDSLGHKLVTGISVWSSSATANLQSQNVPLNSAVNLSPPRDASAYPARSPASSGSAHELIVTSYQNLVQRYDNLVRNYHRLFMTRSQGVNVTDRGTDPMEVDPNPAIPDQRNPWMQHRPPSNTNTNNSTPITYRNPSQSAQAEEEDSSNNNQPLNLSTFPNGTQSNSTTLNRASERTEPLRFFPNIGESTQGWGPENLVGNSIFQSRSSAFRPLIRRIRRFQHLNIMNWETPPTRQTRSPLPNPFTSVSDRPQHSFSYSDNMRIRQELRASLNRLQGYMENSVDETIDFWERYDNRNGRSSDFVSPRRNIFHNEDNARQNIPNLELNMGDISSLDNAVAHSDISSNTSQTITHSLDVIRNILQDSGNRLLNLISDISDDNVSMGFDPQQSSNLSETATPSDMAPPDTRDLISNRLPNPEDDSDEILSSDSDSDSISSIPRLYRNEARNSIRPEHIDDVSEPTTTSILTSVNNCSNMDHVTTSGYHPLQRSRSEMNLNLQSFSNGPSTSRTPANDDIPFSMVNEPSTSSNHLQNSDRSGDHVDRPVGENISSSEAFGKVTRGIAALQTHTATLTNMWVNNGPRPTMRQLRAMWEDLRRQMWLLHRADARSSTFYTPSFLGRNGLLSQIARRVESSQRNSGSESTGNDCPIHPPGSSLSHREDTQSERCLCPSVSNSDSNTSGPSTSGTSTNAEKSKNNTNCNPMHARSKRISQTRNAAKARNCISSFRRRLQSGYRLRSEDDFRRRLTNASTNLVYRYLSSNRGPQSLTRSAGQYSEYNMRSLELHVTRHGIRLRAMQVLAIMFNMMMGCLEENQLSNQIILMLKMLKKALGITCLLLISNNNEQQRNGAREASDPSPNVNCVKPETSERATTTQNTTVSLDTSPQSELVGSGRTLPRKWSNRLAVQISAANRNFSAKAIHRKELYHESKRYRALHRHRPIEQPNSISRRASPSLTRNRVSYTPIETNNECEKPVNTMPCEPVAGPSSSRSTPSEPVPNGSNNGTAESNDPRPNSSILNDYRSSLIRIAQLHSRLRYAARNRYRVRLYTPNSIIRDMLNSMQFYSNDNTNEPVAAPQNANEAEQIGIIPIPVYRGQLVNQGNSENVVVENNPPFASVLINNMTVPLVQVNNVPINDLPIGENPEYPRVPEYLQPIILAQNALATDDGHILDGGSNLVAESLASPGHRIQAWDFTRGEIPNISNANKNVVVQKCKIHNDASIDLSRDGKLLVALLPATRMRSITHRLGVYSLEWSQLGQCLWWAELEQSAVSVALSPCARHLAVGLGARRISLTTRNSVMAIIYRLGHDSKCNERGHNSSRLVAVRALQQGWEPHGFTSLNCLRWAPQPGQGLVYANNTGHLKILS